MENPKYNSCGSAITHHQLINNRRKKCVSLPTKSSERDPPDFLSSPFLVIHLKSINSNMFPKSLGYL